MHITEIFQLNTNGHKDIDFVDIDESLDTRLYIDPYVIQALPNDFCNESRKCIDSFFKEIFKACREKNHKKLHELLNHASEPNETNLGMKVCSKYGRGNTSTELAKLFLDFYNIVQRNPYIESNPLALCMYIQNFAEDKMSDLITNIIRKQLYQFTLKQANIWNIELGNKVARIGYYWDYNFLSWRELKGNPFLVNNEMRLLVPKLVVRKRYIFNVECYIKQYILKTLQQDIISNHPEKCIVKERKNGKKELIPPSRRELYPDFVNGKIHKEFAFNHSVINKKDEDYFIKNILSRIKSGYGALNDRQLDKIVYKKYRGDFFEAS